MFAPGQRRQGDRLLGRSFAPALVGAWRRCVGSELEEPLIRCGGGGGPEDHHPADGSGKVGSARVAPWPEVVRVLLEGFMLIIPAAWS